MGSGTSISEISESAELEHLIRTESRGIVMEFWSTWCRPCRVLRPHLERLARHHVEAWRFVAVHVEKSPELVEAWSVKGTPTLIYLRDGKERHRTAGAVTPSMIEANLGSVI